MKSKFLVATAILLMLTGLSASAQHLVRGRVTDRSGEPIPGASVLILRTQSGVLTDLEGAYVVECKANDELEFAFIGMKTVREQVNGRKTLDVVLSDDVTALQEAVVVGYGTLAKTNISNAISSVKGAELLKAPAVGVTGMVGTRVAGVVALQQSGQPGADASSLLVRGQGAVCIVDGVKRDMNEIDPNEIESISVLKDATSAAMYGLNSTAVILVTTKRGDSQRTRISYNGEYGISRNTNMLRLLSGPEYAYWYNKADELDAQAFGREFTPVFTQEQIRWMQEGSHGWGDTDWYGKTFGVGTTQHHSVNASGGNDRSRFFASIGYFDQDGNVDNFNYKRYNIRSNVDTKINDFLSFELNIAGRMEIRQQPGFSANPNDWHNIPQQAVRALPYVPETYEINGVSYPVSTRTASNWVNAPASATQSGTSETRTSYIQTNMSLRYDAPWLQGLYFKAMASYDLSYQNAKNLSTPFKTAILTLPVAGTTDLSYTLGNDSRGNNTTLVESAYHAENITTNISANFDRQFGKHYVKAIAFMETFETRSHTIGTTGYGLDFLTLDELDFITNQTGAGSEQMPKIGGRSTNTREAGFAGRINYSYDERYLLELSCRHDGSYLFRNKSGARWVTLPGVSLGWNIHKENWFNAPWVNELKLRASAGKTAQSSISAWQYLDLFKFSKNQVVMGGVNTGMVYASTLGNPNLTWAKIDSYNAGVDFTAWNGLLGVEFDVFYKYEYDILSSVTGAYAPSRGGYYYSYANENKRDYRGFDFTIRHDNYIGDFNYGAKLLLSYAYRRWLYYAGDSENAPDYQRLTGKEVGVQYGYIADGLFQSEEDIKNSATMISSKVAPGYIKYVDRNGDGQITYAQDMGYVAPSAYPRVQGSLNLYANWKGFDIDVLFQGAAGRTVALTGQYTATGSEGIMDNTFLTKPFYHGGNSPLFLLENSWTPENTDAEFPRASITSLSSNNAYSSTFWYRDGSYLRLKTLQIGYTLPVKVIKPLGISSLRVYAQGSNLFTLSELTKYNIDPEQPGVNNGYYPQQQVYQLGVKVTF